jgi:protoporphyrinogen oxidase
MLEIKFGPFAPVVPTAWMAGRLRQRMTSRQRNGDERLGYLKGSLSVLLSALLAALRDLGVTILTSAPVTRLHVHQRRLCGIQTPAGTIESDRYLFTIPTIHLAPLVEAEDSAYAAELKRVEYFGAVCTILELDRPLSEIYWLNVADPGFPFGGVIEHTNLIAPAHYGGSHIVYLSRYFESTNALASLSREAVYELMVSALPRIYRTFDRSWIRNWFVFRTATAATVCDLNFSQRVPACAMPFDGGYLATMAHVYPDERSCNNSIRVAAEACRVMGVRHPQVPAGRSLSGQIGM